MDQPPADDGPSGLGELRHYLQHHLPPGEQGAPMLALMYLAGRADLVAELIDGFEAGRHPTAVLKQADVSDAELASRFGLDPVWTTGLRAGENVTVPPPPTLEELVELQKRMAAAAESDQRA